MAKYLDWAVSLTLLFTAAGCSGKAPRPKTDVATPAAAAPALPAQAVGPLAGGAALPLTEIVRGKVAVIDLWATWCTACREVSKNIDLLAEAHKGQSFVAVGLNVGEEREIVAAFLEGRAPKVAIYLDPEFHVADALGARELPTVLVVDTEQRIRLVRKKVDSDVIRLVDQLLAGQPGAAPAAPAN